MAKQTQGANIDIAQFQLFQIEFFLVGTSPLMPHAVSAKAKEMLLYPTGRKNAADRASSMKHEPFEEFREAAYQFRDADQSATRLYMPAGAFHAAIADAALDIIGATKTQIGRLTRIVGEKIPIWGIPQIASMIVVPSGMKRTPDVRTLPVLPAWCCKISVMFPSALIKPQSVANLLGAPGSSSASATAVRRKERRRTAAGEFDRRTMTSGKRSPGPEGPKRRMRRLPNRHFSTGRPRRCCLGLPPNVSAGWRSRRNHRRTNQRPRLNLKKKLSRRRVTVGAGRSQLNETNETGHDRT